MISSQQLPKIVLQSDDEFRELSERHRELESRLSELSCQLYRTHNEELEKSNLKKHKLQLKDRMEAILRRRRGPTASRQSSPGS